MHEVETMAFAGETPWHGLGNPISNDLTPEQMMVEAGCDWEVKLTNNCYPADHEFHAGQPIENSNFIERISDGQILGHYVAGDYKPVQNKELFEFFSEFVNNGSMYLHTAGSLFGGQKVWCMATTNEGFDLGDDDWVHNNLLFTISHTGKHANSALNTPVRVVCANTMRLAMGGAEDIVTHNHRAVFDAEALKVALGVSSKNFGKLEGLAKQMAQRVLQGEEEIEYFRSVFGGKEREDKSGKLIHSEGVRKAMAYFRGQEFAPNSSSKETKDAQIRRQQEIIDGLLAGKSHDEIQEESEIVSKQSSAINMGWDKPSAQGTLWGAFNTVTYMSDHKPVRDHGQDNRLDKAFYGAGATDIKTKAFNKAKELLVA
tara:strand:+ start:2979 stop:4094 length:1116 start_codon:yes stop_codon:yes gene_type:complete